MRRSLKILSGFAVIFILIQFIRPEKNQHEGKQPADIFAKYPSSPSTVSLVKTACYDCHSNHTNYPWYAEIQPVAAWLDHHIDEGKTQLNFSEFDTYPARAARHGLEEVIETVKEKEMPLKSYAWIHKEAQLSDAERREIADWASTVISQIK